MVKNHKVTSCFSLLKLYLYFWTVGITSVVVLSVITLPWKIYLFLTRPAYDKSKNKIDVVVHGPKSAAKKDDLLFIHGWPDSGSLWDEQV